MIVLHHLDMPLTRQNSFNVAPGTETQISVTPSLITTTENAIMRFTSEERDCYVDDEISLKYLRKEDGYRYGMDNCLFTSALEQILNTCKCYPGYNYNLIPKKSNKLSMSISQCIGSNLTCMNDILHSEDGKKYVDANGRKMKCRSRCEDQVNKLFVSRSYYPSINTFPYREEFCFILQRILKKCKSSKKKALEKRYPGICKKLTPFEKLNSTQFCYNNQWNPKNVENCIQTTCPIVEDAVFDYARGNLVLIHIFIKDPYVKRFKKDEKMSVISYIANVGGLLGFMLGFSIITGIEIIYYFLSGVILSIFSKPTNNNLNKQKRKQNVMIETWEGAETSNQNQQREISAEMLQYVSCL